MAASLILWLPVFEYVDVFYNNILMLGKIPHAYVNSPKVPLKSFKCCMYMYYELQCGFICAKSSCLCPVAMDKKKKYFFNVNHQWNLGPVQTPIFSWAESNTFN